MTKLLTKAYTWVEARRNHNDEEGQTVIEYALVVALVSIVLATTLIGFGNDIIGAAQDAVSGELPGAGSSD